MFVRICFFVTLTASAVVVAVPLFDYATSFAQDSGVNLALHANSHASAADVGLPAYPGATPYKESDNDSTSADLGFTFNEVHFSMKAAKYQTGDSPSQILAFYRKPLSRYGQVLECDHGKPVGTPAVTNTGLKCEQDGDNSTDHELRAGSPHQFRIVAIEPPASGSTRFGLVYLDLPRDE
jgi:hypothetical protein